LFKSSLDYAQQLKNNCAEALGKLNHRVSYEYNINKLTSHDDWDRIEAAQFLANYGNKDAVIPILESMEHSGMAELIAGEIATLVDVYELFEEGNEKTRELALEAMDNILSGLPEVWPLGVVLDFKIFECLDRLIYLSKENKRNEIAGKYAQILLKAKQKFTMFINNSEYTYDEEKDILAELEEINQLLMFENEKFWGTQFQNLLKELDTNDRKRKLSAISVLHEIESDESAPYLIKTALKQDEDEVVICEAITALAKIGHTEKLDKELLLSRIKDPNLIAIVQNSLTKV
jgi:hypothetical protein